MKTRLSWTAVHLYQGSKWWHNFHMRKSRHHVCHRTSDSRKGWPTTSSFHHRTRCWQFYSCVFDTETRSGSKHTLALFRSTVLFSHICWSVYGEGLEEEPACSFGAFLSFSIRYIDIPIWILLWILDAHFIMEKANIPSRYKLCKPRGRSSLYTNYNPIK